MNGSLLWLKSYKRIMLIVLLPTVVVSGCASIPPPLPATVVASGIGVGYVMLQSHKRTLKEYWNDSQLDRIITRHINKDVQLKANGRTAIHVNVTVFNEVILLTGEVPTQGKISRIIDIVKSYAKSRQVINRIELAGKSNINSRANDTLITAQVRASLLDSEEIDGHRIKVVTERANVYLMGSVTKKEANFAAQIARSVSGVARVVKVFEYL
ncbi:MAG: transporter [Acidiferrobacteraceae bacterium]|nr:transporter [Acidiferrobacteraceae bacterium]|tara:strand:+ start:1291 stop:1926 length:636 start_codon:yes stop_codon:yes gene_type:complete